MTVCQMLTPLPMLISHQHTCGMLALSIASAKSPPVYMWNAGSAASLNRPLLRNGFCLPIHQLRGTLTPLHQIKANTHTGAWSGITLVSPDPPYRGYRTRLASHILIHSRYSLQISVIIQHASMLEAYPYFATVSAYGESCREPFPPKRADPTLNKDHPY